MPAATISVLANMGVGNIGFANTGSGNFGIGLTGDNLTGFGGFNTGSGNVGLFNSGTGNVGFFNSGTGNWGVFNSGSYNTGIGNSGIVSTGLFNAVGSTRVWSMRVATTPAVSTRGRPIRRGFNPGSVNTGWLNTGDINTGVANSGDVNTGAFISGNYSNGAFWRGDYQGLLGFSYTSTIIPEFTVANTHPRVRRRRTHHRSVDPISGNSLGPQRNRPHRRRLHHPAGVHFPDHGSHRPSLRPRPHHRPGHHDSRPGTRPRNRCHRGPDIQLRLHHRSIQPYAAGVHQR